MVGERWACIVIAASMLAVPLGGVQALNPTDEDAGEPGDAGDERRLARPIDPGTIPGRVTAGVDPVDWYDLEAERGNQLTFAASAPDEASVSFHVLGPDGEVRFLGSETMGSTWILPKTGTWSIEVLLRDAGVFSTAQGSPALPYELEVSLHDVGPVEVHPLNARGQGVELNRSEEGPVAYTMQTRATTGGTDPAVAAIYLRTAPADGNGFATLAHMESDGSGRSLALAREPAPGVDVQLERQHAHDGSQLTMTSSGQFAAAEGALRAVQYGTGASVEGFIAVAGEVETAQAEAEQVLAWGEDDAETDKVLAPGLSAAGGREHAMSVDAPFYGLFDVDDGDGWARAPDGERIAVDPADPLPLLEPERGEWTFHANATMGAGLHARHHDLDGAFVPELGLLPDRPHPSGFAFIVEDSYGGGPG